MKKSDSLCIHLNSFKIINAIQTQTTSGQDEQEKPRTPGAFGNRAFDSRPQKSKTFTAEIVGGHRQRSFSAIFVSKVFP